MRHSRLMVAIAAAVTVLLTPIGAQPNAPTAPLERSADEQSGVFEISVTDANELDRLIATGVDLDHHVSRLDTGIVVHAIVSPTEADALRERGFRVGRKLFDPNDSGARLAERERTIAAHKADNQVFAATSDVKIVRADYYTSGSTQVLSVEAKWAQGQTLPNTLTVERDSGPGTPIGSGGTQTISRFVDAGVYLYHRGASLVTARPDYIRITSPSGGVAIAKVSEWLPIPPDNPEGPGYQKDFVTSYLTPTELYDRIRRLANEFDDLADLIELPHKTNGYRRKAQNVLGTVSASRVAVDSHAWGHEGGNDISIAALNPGAASQPLSVNVTGKDITVSLATDAAGALTSTAADVVAALNANASSLIVAYTYRGNVGTGVVAPAAKSMLTDGLHAPATVSREPHPVYALRIGKTRDGSKPGVLAYAQEHAREWVPPLVTIETAERLLRNYAHDGRTKQLLNNLEIWIAPSINPDGGTTRSTTSTSSAAT